MNKIKTALISALLFVAACTSTPYYNPDEDPSSQNVYLTIALDTFMGTMSVLAQQGRLPEEGMAVVDTALDYGNTACMIMVDRNTTIEHKQAQLAMQLPGKRDNFFKAVELLMGTDLDPSTRVILQPAIQGIASAARQALFTEELDPAVFYAPCKRLITAHQVWNASRGQVAMVPVT